MSPVSHQTVKLSRGKHDSPEAGACVMELASMLAGEAFSDHPQTVCPVIADLLRSYNDTIDDRRRQDLYQYASRVVGSRSSTVVEQSRRARIRQWSAGRRPWWTRALLGYSLTWLTTWPLPESPGLRAVSAMGPPCERSHTAMLALIDELLSLGADGSSTFGGGVARRSTEQARDHLLDQIISPARPGTQLDA
jgi:hypothetical protein